MLRSLWSSCHRQAVDVDLVEALFHRGEIDLVGRIGQMPGHGGDAAGHALGEMARTVPRASMKYGPMINWFDSRWIMRSACVPPTLSGRT